MLTTPSAGIVAQDRTGILCRACDKPMRADPYRGDRAPVMRCKNRECHRVNLACELISSTEAAVVLAEV